MPCRCAYIYIYIFHSDRFVHLMRVIMTYMLYVTAGNHRKAINMSSRVCMCVTAKHEIIFNVYGQDKAFAQAVRVELVKRDE